MINKELQKRILSSIILIPLALFFIIKGSEFLIFFLSVCFFITSFEWYMMSKKRLYNIPGHIFIIISFYTVYLVRGDHLLIADSHGILIIVLICISTDVGGYLFGKLFKGPKLTKISPNKTYAGMIGGYLLSLTLGSFFIFWKITGEGINYFFKTFGNLNSIYGFGLNDLIFIFIVSTISQLGDITISYFKRLSKIKNTGKIIPGHGGLLDRIDGMLFAFPFVYLIYFIMLT